VVDSYRFVESFRFKIEGRLWGYKQGRKEAHRPEREAFKNRVRLLGNLAGVPAEIPERPGYARIIVEVYWAKLARIDGKNVLGLIEDSLWVKDRMVRFGTWEWYENQGEEFAQVFVKIYQGDKT